MIGFVDKKIKKLLKRILHKRRDKFLNKTIKKYMTEHSADTETIKALRDALNLELDRIFAIVDNSIINARLKQARYTFWITAIIATCITLSVAVFPITTSLLPFFIPVMGALVAWAVSIGTIPFNYNERIQGSMDSALIVFEHDIKAAKMKGLKAEAIETNDLRNKVLQLQQTVIELKNEIDHIGPVPATAAKKTRYDSLWELPVQKEVSSYSSHHHHHHHHMQH